MRQSESEGERRKEKEREGGEKKQSLAAHIKTLLVLSSFSLLSLSLPFFAL